MLISDEKDFCSAENVEFENLTLFYSKCRMLDARDTCIFLSALILTTSGKREPCRFLLPSLLWLPLEVQFLFEFR